VRRVPATRRYGTHAWELEVPAGIIGRAVEPPSESPYDSMFILRGWLNETAPATLVVTTRARKGVTLRSEARRLGAGFEQPPGDGTAIEVAGAHGARRIDGTIDLGEGVSEDGIDRVATIVAAGRRALVLLSIRTRPVDEAAAELERALRSFALLDA
jgi:hypothetical protein